MTELKALIFDVDGTLAETERDGHRLAFNRAFAHLGLDWEWSIPLYGTLLEVSGGKERVRYYLEQYLPDFLVKEDLDRFIADLHQLKTQYYRELLSQGAIPLRPGVERIIKEAICQGVRLAIATTSALPNALALLEQTLDPNWFEVIAAGDIVPAKKPAPDIYEYVLEQMNLSADECLVFEDSHHGLQASRGAGLRTLVTLNEYTQAQDFTEAFLVVNHLGEPEQPLTVIQGDLGDNSYIDITLLKGFRGSWT